jgi:hypothetical protein
MLHGLNISDFKLNNDSNPPPNDTLSIPLCVTSIDVNAFYGLQRLRNLNVESNYLDVKSLKLGVFERIPNLVSMDLSSNLFHISNGYPDKVLSVLSQLQSLTINGMDNVSFGGGFESLLSLKSFTSK